MKNIFTLLSVFIFGFPMVFAQSNSFPEEGNVLIRQTSSGSFRAYDVANYHGNIVSRLEATNDGSGQLWLRDPSSNYKVYFKSGTSPSFIVGDLVLGEVPSSSKGRKLFVKGETEFTGNIFTSGNVELKQNQGDYFKALDLKNFNNTIVSRFEATTDGSGQLWLKDHLGQYQIIFRSKDSPSCINGELVIGDFTPNSKHKKLYVKGDSWLEGQLGVDGKITSEEVKVQVVNAPDYVFAEDYNLRSLLETKQYIEDHQHLPEIPSAKEMEKEGVDLGKMNMKLLQKIEELTLHQIQLQEQLLDLKQEVDSLRSKGGK
ncbi:hypothetical protein FUAX_52890 (plasmid) [Fulvitalea axinellae]|uniref:Uncharacterized protein n=1 Tax=Fulvitalea axinellae TaxID=1182444 RepID=A0AAU9D138_9BACT|nr:hypothetical protein FUAX_52890 [Fulvitalea axinellae]